MYRIAPAEFRGYQKNETTDYWHPENTPKPNTTKKN